MAEEKKKIRQPVTGGVAKTPVIMQMEALECGAACLTMVLAYYEKWIPLEQVRLACGVSRDGSNAGNVLKAARGYGLTAAGYRLEPEELKKNGQYPAIIHWNFNHFVVLCGFKGDKAIINDPGQGKVAIDMKTFDESFTGVALIFEPGDGFEPSGKPKSIWGFARKRLAGTGTAIAFVVITTLITSLIGVLNNGFTRVFYDRILGGGNPKWVMPFIALLAVMSAVQIVTAAIQAIYSLRLNGKMAIIGNTTYMWKVLRMPMEFFSQRMAGDIQSRQATNASIASALIETLAPLALNAIMMIFYLVVMLRISPMLTLVGLVSILINMAVAKVISEKRVNITRVQMRDQGKLSGSTVSGIEMIETIKAAGAENGFFEKWAGYQAGVNTQSVRYARLNKMMGLVPDAVSGVTAVIVLVLGVLLVLKGKFTPGVVMQFQGYLSLFTAPATTLIQSGQTIQEMQTDMERVEDVMEYPDDANYNDAPFDEAADYEKLSGSLEMKNVTFGYSRLGEPLIRDFNLTLKPGSRVAFVGSSGCGKSTLGKLISGLYSPWSGEILFDGKPIREIDRSVFTGSLAVVDQDIILFEDTISNNIKMWDSSIEDFEVILAARDAQIHEDILKRDGGYSYKLTEGGRDFSGGQRQRMEIARVLAQDPTIIILDEATSALDAKTEYEVVKSIKERGITCIVVAHRLSTIRDCDEIIVMDHGNVVERGTHEELYAKGGFYTQLVTDE